MGSLPMEGQLTACLAASQEFGTLAEFNALLIVSANHGCWRSDLI